jgi:CubicO group peptidase (beta-lactamase class C family)
MLISETLTASAIYDATRRGAMPVKAGSRIAALDQIIQEQIQVNGPGVAVAVIHQGEVIHSVGYGMANLEWSQRIHPDTVFGIGSMTKPFTATAILLLERDGLLDINEPLTTYLPGYDTHGVTITLAHLLTHTSGIPNFVTRPGFWERIAPLDHDPTQLRALFETLPLDFTPGERYSYSNSGYCLLGMVIERVSGMLYREFTHDRIFAPLGMTATDYLDDERVIPHLAARYVVQGSAATHPHSVNHTMTYSAGALHSTVEDLALWDAALREARLLDRATLERMERPLTLNSGQSAGYGLGWGISTFRGRRVVHHAGGVPGYSSFLGRFVDDGLTIIILSNWGLFDAASLLARPIALKLLDIPELAVTDLYPAELSEFSGLYANYIGDQIEFSVADGLLRATGELNADLIAIAPATFRAIHDPDVTVTFEDAGTGRYSQATIIVPFYWYTVYRNPSTEVR